MISILATADFLAGPCGGNSHWRRAVAARCMRRYQSSWYKTVTFTQKSTTCQKSDGTQHG